MQKYTVKNISEHKKEFQTAKMKIPAVFHTSDDLLPEDKAFEQLENLAQDERLFHHIAAMSDIHPKKGRKNPTGTVIATKKHLLPQINDTAPNCGMRFIKTNLTEENFSPEKIDQVFQELTKVIPTKKYIGSNIPFDLALDICQNGIAPLIKHLGSRTKNEIQNTSHQGNFFSSSCHLESCLPAGRLVSGSMEISKQVRNDNCIYPTKQDILDAIPPFFIHIGRFRLGILGAAGNHFLDLMKITEIKNESIAQKFGIKKGQYIFLMHTGSGLLGQYASYMYTPKVKEHLSQQLMLQVGLTFFKSKNKKIYAELAKEIEKYKHKDEFFGYDDNTPEGKMFLTAHHAAANFGFANRTYLNNNLDRALEKVFGKQVELDLLYDTPHIFIDKENHFGEDVWIHRNGTVRANGPKRMNNHPLFSQTGEPVFIPSSMSTPAYLCVGTDENESSFFSASHGTGRRKKPMNDIPQDKETLFKRMKETNVRLYNAKSTGVIEQDRSHYKDVEEVISGMEDNKVVSVVAKMEPVAVLMY